MSLTAAVDRWAQDVADGFALEQLPMRRPASGPPTADWPSTGAVMTYGALMAAFAHLPTDEALVYLVAADRAMDVLDDRPALSPQEQLDAVAGQLDLLHGALAAVADGLRSMSVPVVPAASVQPHPALVTRGSPFNLATFRPMPELASLARRTCTVCGRQSLPLEELPVCQVMFLEHHATAPGSESGIAAGFVSMDGWLFTDLVWATTFTATCPDHLDLGADVRPYDAHYFAAYLDLLGHADAPVDSAARYRHMLEVVRRDPFGAPG